MVVESNKFSVERIVVCELGQVPYRSTWELQKQLQAVLVQAKRAEPAEIVPHIMLLVEHPPVYTLGKSGNAGNLLVNEAFLAEKDASFVHIDRGGDITFHGPGQLVGYPILDLDRLSPDIHLYLRNLEEVVIRVCASFGISAGRVEGKTGVWIAASKEQPARKICAMGIRCSRWVTMHGFALNLNTDLSYFEYIVPCGLANSSVTSLSRELLQHVNEKDVRRSLIDHFAEVFSVETVTYNPTTSMEFLEEMTGQSIQLHF